MLHNCHLLYMYRYIVYNSNNNNNCYDLLSLDRWKNQSWLAAFSGQVNGILGLGGRSQGAAFLVYRVHEQLSLGSDHFVRGDP